MKRTNMRGALALALMLPAWGGLGAAEAGAPAPIKVGVFDPSRVFEQSEVGKKMRADIDALTQKKRSEVQSKEDEVKGLQDKLKQEEASLSDEKRGERERILQQKGLELKRLRDDATREVQAQVNDVEEKFQKQVITIIEKLGREEGYTLILDRNSVAYSSSLVDITEQIVTRLNAAPASAPKPK